MTRAGTAGSQGARWAAAGKAARRLLALALALLACQGEPVPASTYAPAYTREPRARPRIYRFGVLPVHNPQRLAEVYGPIVDHLNRHLAGASLQLEASRSYQDFDQKLAGRELDLALANPYQMLASLRAGYRVFGKMGDDAQFRGIILVRRDAGITHVADLKGKVVSFPAPTALAATMMPLRYLHAHGLDVNREIERLFAGSQESSIMSVVLGRSAAGATWPPPWEAFQQRNPALAAQLQVRWETPPLVNNALVARDDVPPELVQRVGALLFGLQGHEEGRRLLAGVPLSGFEPATEATYAPVRAFLDAYAREIR